MKGEAACGTLCQHPECWRADLRRVREAVRARNGIYTRKEDESRRNVGKSDSVQSVDGKCFIVLKFGSILERRWLHGVVYLSLILLHLFTLFLVHSWLAVFFAVLTLRSFESWDPRVEYASCFGRNKSKVIETWNKARKQHNMCISRA